MIENKHAPLWNPAAHNPESTLLALFQRLAERKSGLRFGGHDAGAYKNLNQWAIERPQDFWSLLWDFAEVRGDKGADSITALPQAPFARFFEDSRISYAENILHHASRDPKAPAIIARRQDEADTVLSWQDFHDRVSLWSQALARAGIKEGDRVAVYLPNIPETFVILLAASCLGAVFASAGMEMGGDDLVGRLGQVRPKILITTGAYIHSRKTIDRTDIVARAGREIPGLEKTILLEDENDFLSGLTAGTIDFIRRPFNHPLYILFSSGSTGKPKCFEHSSGGVLLKHLSEHLLNCDIGKGDRVFYHATPSWMMWNWLAGVLAAGATILIYDGNPAHPDAYAQWDFTCAHACTHHGTAAPVILSWIKSGIDLKTRDVTPLRMILSTGAVLPAQGYEFIHAHIKPDVKISSISGGTDIVGCFLGGNPYMPTYAGQINAPMIGMDVRALNDEGDEVKDGEAGELACLNAFPSMPLRFLDDEAGERYMGEYFNHYAGRRIWRHGDTVQKTKEGQFVIIGRSDATLNQNGVRIGPAVIYDQLIPFGRQIADAAAIDFTRPDNKQAITILFLELADNADTVPADLQNAIRSAVKDNVTPYAVPTEIIAVPGILKTPNGKKAELVMKKIINGQEIPNASLYGNSRVVFYENFGKILKTKYSG